MRVQSVPCDASIQLEDTLQPLTPEDASHFRSIVGTARYLGRDRPDVMEDVQTQSYGITNLRELVGYLKGTGNPGVKLSNPMPGHGKWKVSNEAQWVLETFSDADGKPQPQEIDIMCSLFVIVRKRTPFDRFLHV